MISLDYNIMNSNGFIKWYKPLIRINLECQVQKRSEWKWCKQIFK